MRWKWYLGLLPACASPISAIFTDDAFHVDYHQALLGIPQSHTTFFHKPQSSSNASLLYTISDKAVLGAVNPRDGSLVWRQALAGSPKEEVAETYLVAGDSDGRLTSGYQSSVASWDALDGRLIWTHTFDTGLVKGVLSVPTIAKEAVHVIQDVIAVAGPSKDGSPASVVRLAGDGSAPRWQFQDKSASRDALFAVAVSPKYVYYITKSSGLLSGGKAKVVVIDLTTGKESSQYSITVDSETIHDSASLSFGSGSETAFLLSTEKPYKSLKFNLLGNSKSVTLSLEDKGEEIHSLKVHHVSGPNAVPHFLVHVIGKTKQWAEIFHVNKKSGDATKAYSLPATSEISTFSATSVGPAVYFTRLTDSEISLYSSESHGHVGRWSRLVRSASQSRDSLHAATEVSSRGSSNIALRVALSSSVRGWSLIRNGEQSWSRPENLAYITKAIWSDDYEAANLAHEIEVEASSNPVSAYLSRLARHVRDLMYLPQRLVGISGSITLPSEDTGKSVRERLGGSKLILASTSRGDILALDATSAGSVRWVSSLPEAAATQAIHLSASEDRLTVYFADGQFVVLNVTNGQVLERQKSSKPFGKIVALPGRPASAIVRISAAGVPEVFSELAPAEPTEGNILVTVNEHGEALGWSIGTSIEKIWTLRPDNGAKITDVIARSSHDPVASIGNVLGDRSVLYKYINPNIALLTALSSSALSVYLINAVTGAVLYTATHENVLQDLPISAVVSGNKFTYSFTIRDSETSGLSSQIIASELYESETPNDRGLLSAKSNYSSFSPDAGARPYVESKAFTLAEPLSHLAVSQTSLGITSRHVLGYLPDSRSVVGISGEALNARRPVDRDPTSTEMEEGLMRYSPILDLDPKSFLSHSREVYGIKKLMTAPTLLESTSLLFAYGHDIFGSQVAPSNTFDVLGKGFKRVQLVLTVVGLYAGVLAIRPIARKKMVERRWL